MWELIIKSQLYQHQDDPVPSIVLRISFFFVMGTVASQCMGTVDIKTQLKGENENGLLLIIIHHPVYDVFILHNGLHVN